MPFIDDSFFALYRGGNPARTPIILLHGMGSSHLVWPGSIRRLEGENVYALDLPGHGKSGGNGLQLISGYASIVVQFMDEAKIYRAILIGHSMGSAIALQVARDHSERVVGLGLLSVGTSFHIEKSVQESIENTKMLSDSVECLSKKLFGRKIDKRLADKVVKGLSEVRPTVLAADIHACMGYQFRKFQETISISTRIINGAEDQIVPPRDAILLAESIPGAELEIISHSGHMVMLEESEQVGELLTSFVKKVNSTIHYA
ncbi:MAG: alpha/beta fold hydrolase [Anaerolineaceae bacterium]